MSHNEKTSSVPYAVKVIIGVLFMLGGTYLSVNADKYLPFQKDLAAKGTPIDIGITFAVIGVFLILFPVINFFYFTPLREAIQTRNGDLERTFSEIEDLRSEMVTMRTDYEHRLTETEAKAREQIQSSIREAQQLRQTLMAEATDKADDMVRRAQEEIQAEKDRVLTDLRLHVSNLALTAAEKIIGENMDTDKNRKLVDEFISSVEVTR